jgi:hypothetical protein
LRRTLGKAAFTVSDVLATINFFEDFGLVGVADYLDEYLAALFERCGRTRPFSPAFLNRTEDQPDPERAGAKTLRTGRSTVSEEIWARLTWGEQRVYEHFKKRFEREHAERIFNTRVHYGKILRSKAS